MLLVSGELVAEIYRLTDEERRLFFRNLKKEVTRIVCELDPASRSRWSISARKLVEVLDFFETDPTDTLACTMEQAVELACEFLAQVGPKKPAGICTTLH